MTRSTLSLSLALALALVGCTDADSGSGVDTQDPSGSTDTTDKISFNGLVLHAALLQELSTQPLTTGVIQDVDLPLNIAASNGLEQTTEGRELLEYVARCALPNGTNLLVEGSSFPGHVGLATEWADNQCDEECQGWMTACLLAHANLTGATIAISLRGSHPALQPTESEMAEFTQEEAAFYGNLFAPGDAATNLFGCLGDLMNPLDEDFDPLDPIVDVSAALDDTYLTNRVCGAGACGFQNTGLCYMEAPFTGDQLGVCGFDGGEIGYSECGDGTGFGPVFDQVITVHLHQ